MATDVKLPDLGEGVEDATISRWLVKEGDEVNEGDVLLEVATDKVDTEVPSPVAGKVLKINQAEGEKQRVIKESEASKQQQINEAEGEAEAILAVATATAEGLRRVGEALAGRGGMEPSRLLFPADRAAADRADGGVGRRG